MRRSCRKRFLCINITDYLIDIFDKYSITPESILETACGTGQITVRLAGRGYKLVALDISESMLSIAEEKARQKKLKIKFLNQDMTRLAINNSFDCILCMCDGVNYIVDEVSLNNYFKRVYEKLNSNGIFIFDISTHYKLSEILGNNTLYYEKDDIHYIWDNAFDENDDIANMNLIFFVPSGKSYDKIEEYHIQKAYKIDYLKNLLEAVGFKNIDIYGELSFYRPMDNDNRNFFIAMK
jgi:ubiquinone/menaquinone biosynthesis C-methylase UbiE